MNSLLRGVGSGFGRTIGRIFGYLFIGIIIYILINALGIDIKSIIPRVSIGGLLL